MSLCTTMAKRQISAGSNWWRLHFLKRVALTENGHYATPKIHFDKTKEKGHPFAYHVYGTDK
jgi:xanthine dehydrogenase large subunit